MKKRFVWILVMVFLGSAAFACAEQEESFFARFDGLEWWLSSGAGGWSTDLQIFPDGSFAGTYHDSEMGDAADEYPDGTLYICSFTGRMSLAGHPEDNPLAIRVEELNVDEPAEREYIEDGVRYIYTEPYGLSAGDNMVLYAPGTDIGAFTDDMLLWSHVLDSEDTIYELESWFLWSEATGSGFVAFPHEP